MFMGRELPDDFEAVFIAVGRQGCEEHYRVGRQTVTAWLDLAGHEQLRRNRANRVQKQIEHWGETHWRPVRRCPPDFDRAFVELGVKGCTRRYSAGWRTIRRWLNERGRERLETARARYLGKRLNVVDVARALSQAFPANVSASANFGTTAHKWAFEDRKRKGII